MRDNFLDDQYLKLIFNAIESGKCLAFLGAGASCCFYNQNQEEVPGLPTGIQLAESLAKECGYSINGKYLELPKAAEYFVYTRSGDRQQLEKLIQRELTTGCKPRPIHTALAQLFPIKIIITSNYDTLFEDEAKRYGRLLDKSYYKRNGSQNALYLGKVYNFEEKDLILYKMHGCIDEPKSIIISESDYIRYLANLKDPDRGMPDYFWKTMIPQSILLFLGYSLEDWNFKVIWEGVLSNQRNLNTQIASYALVKESDPFKKTFWEGRNIKILDYDLTEFAIKVAEHFKLEIPQLGIEKKTEVTKP